MTTIRSKIFQLIDNKNETEFFTFLKSQKNWYKLLKPTIVVNDTNVTPFTRLAETNQWNTLHKLLCELITNFNIDDSKNRFCFDKVLLTLTSIAPSEFKKYCDKPQYQLAIDLIAAGAGLASIDHKYPLHFAIDHNFDKEFIELLCNHKNDWALLYPQDGNAPAIYAAHHNKWEILFWIVKKNIPIFSNHAVKVLDILLEKKEYDKIKELFLDSNILARFEKNLIENLFKKIAISAAQHDNWEMVKAIALKDPAIFAKVAVQIFEIAIVKKKENEIEQLYLNKELENAFDGLIEILANTQDPTRIEFIFRWLEQKKNQIDLFKHPYYTVGKNKGPVLFHISEKKNWLVANKLLDHLKKHGIKETSPEKFYFGSLLIDLILNNKDVYDTQWANKKPEITQEALAQKTIDFNCNFWTLGGDKHLLHLAIDYHKSNEFIILLCTQTNLLDRLYKSQNPFVYAAEKAEWSYVNCMAEVDPARFAKSAKQVFDMGISQKKYEELSKLLSAAVMAQLGNQAQELLSKAIISAANENNFNTVYLFANISPSDFTGAASKVFEIGIQKKNYAGLTRLICSDLFTYIPTSPTNSLFSQVVFSAEENNDWDILFLLAEKCPIEFSKSAKRILELGIQKKKFNELNKLFENKNSFSSFDAAIDELIKSKEMTKTNEMFHWLHTAAKFNLPFFNKIFAAMDKESYLTNPLKLTSPKYENMTLLEVACKNGSHNCLNFIIDRYELRTPYLKLGALQKANRLIDIKNWHMPQALFYAVQTNSLYFANIFLQYGTPFLSDGFAEASEAVKNGNQKILQLLVDNKANLNTREDDKSLLVIAVNLFFASNNEATRASYKNIIELLLSSGASVNTFDGKESKVLIEAVHKNDLGLAALFLNYNASVQVKNNDDHLLLNAVNNKSIAMTALLTQNNAPITNTHSNKSQALINAVASSSTDIVQLLLNHNSTTINDRDERGNILLHIASTNKNAEMTRLLLSFGADPNIENNSSDNMEADAELIGSHECVTVFKELKMARYQAQLAFLDRFQKLQFKREYKPNFWSQHKIKEDNYIHPAFEKIISTEIPNLNRNNAESVEKLFEKVRKTLRDQYENHSALFPKELEGTLLEADKIMTSWPNTSAMVRSSSSVMATSEMITSSTSASPIVGNLYPSISSFAGAGHSLYSNTAAPPPNVGTSDAKSKPEFH